MNIEKLHPQCVALGRAYKILTEAYKAPSEAALHNAPFMPMPQVTQALTQCFKYKKMTPYIHRAMTELFSIIDIEDNHDLQGPMPAELQGAFMHGYLLGAEGLFDKSKLATMRKKRKLSQAELAERIGVSQRDISRWEGLKNTPSADYLRALAKALDCTMEDIIEDGE